MNDVTRRDALRLGLGAAAAGLLGSPAIAADATPEQAEGPFFPKRDRPDKDADLTRVKGRSGNAQGKEIFVSGCILDASGAPVAGALIDIWQANTHGRYDHEDDTNPAPLDPDFQGSAQLLTGADGRYSFRSIMPGAYPAEEGWNRPPHIHIKVARRGYRELITQMYFAGNELNAKDQLLQELPVSEQERLMVRFQPDANRQGLPSGVFDIVITHV